MSLPSVLTREDETGLRPERSRRMRAAVRRLDDPNLPASTPLTRGDAMGLLTNLHLILRRNVPLRQAGRSGVASLQNQINRPRWRFLNQLPTARQHLLRSLRGTGVTVPAWL